MRRALASAGIGAILAACGLSVQGIEPIGGEEAGVGVPQPGPDGTTIVTLPDGNTVVVDGTAPGIDGQGPADAQAEIQPIQYPDAHVPMPADCNRNTCTPDQMTAKTCFIESCNKGDATRHWPNPTSNLEMTVAEICVSDTAVVTHATLEAPSQDYSFSLQIVAPNVPDNVTFLVMEFGDRRILLARKGNDYRLCYISSNPDQCVTRPGLGNDVFNLYGSLSKTSPFASITLTTDTNVGDVCTGPSVVLDLATGPFPASWTAIAGCVQGTCNNFSWWDARVELITR